MEEEGEEKLSSFTILECEQMTPGRYLFKTLQIYSLSLTFQPYLLFSHLLIFALCSWGPDYLQKVKTPMDNCFPEYP